MAPPAPGPVGEALRLTPADDGLLATLRQAFSNAPTATAPERGGPLGGLIAGLAVEAARGQLELEPPLQSLSVQFLAAARFAPLTLQARRLRGGRSIAYVEITGQQGPRQVFVAHALFSANSDGPALTPLTRPPPQPPEALAAFESDDTAFPWFHRQFEYRFETASRYGQTQHPPHEAVWMRTRDEACLDEARLCALLDAIYPTFMTGLPRPPRSPSPRRFTTS